MPRLSSESNYNLDHVIVSYLEKNPQASVLEISRQISRGYSATLAHINRLMRDGVLMRMIKVMKPTLPCELFVTLTLRSRQSFKDFVGDLELAISANKSPLLGKVCLVASWVNFAGSFSTEGIGTKMADGLTLHFQVSDMATSNFLRQLIQGLDKVHNVHFIEIKRL